MQKRSGRAIRVLVVDDSVLFRGLLAQGLAADPTIEVVGTAADPFEARDQIIALQPDVMTCDIEMPRMNGIEFIRRLLPQVALPVIVVSTVQEAVLDALAAGAFDFVAKPRWNEANRTALFLDEVKVKIQAAMHAQLTGARRFADVSAGPSAATAGPVAATARPAAAAAQPAATAAQPTAMAAQPGATAVQRAGSPRGTAIAVIAIGASTGGTEAIAQLLRALPRTAPGIVITQHIPAGFSRMFAERLDHTTPFSVKEAESGDYVMPGRVLIAPGDQHMRVKRHGAYLRVECAAGDRVSGHCPSVDVLFQSVADASGSRAVGILLTGMGSDGANGLLAMRGKGARTIGQDEQSCAVYGMPKAAFEIGAVEQQAPLDRIAGKLAAML